MLFQCLLHQHSESVEAFAHIGVAQRQTHLHAAGTIIMTPLLHR